MAARSLVDPEGRATSLVEAPLRDPAVTLPQFYLPPFAPAFRDPLCLFVVSREELMRVDKAACAIEEEQSIFEQVSFAPQRTL